MDEAITILSGMSAAQKRNISATIQEYSKRLLGFIRRRVDTEEDAEDILQDVFYQFIGQTTPVNEVAAWLFKVARNKITDKYRKRRPELLDDVFSSPDEESLEWSEILLDVNGGPETEFLRSLFWEELDEALQELPAEQRDVFVLHELEQIPFKDISERTGIPVNTLISRKRYAVLHLRDRLQGLRDELLNY